MARLPIGDTAMTGAERQRRHRASHRQEETLEAKCRRLAAENARLKRAKVGMTERLPTKRIVELLWLALGARKCAAVAQALLRRWNDDVRDAGGAQTLLGATHYRAMLRTTDRIKLPPPPSATRPCAAPAGAPCSRPGPDPESATTQSPAGLGWPLCRPR